MAFAPPVSKGDFHYNGDLYVEVGNLNRHKRATVGEITAILRPDVKKSKKASADPAKDQVGHWYEAQLIHYGLPPSKDKARAKMRLLEALNTSRLNVPPNINKLESELKKEYAAAEKKARAQLKASQAPAKISESPAAGKKRKQSESAGNANNINISISFGDGSPQVSGGVNGSESHPPAKRAKTAPSKPTKKQPEEPGPSKPTKKNAGQKVKQQSSQAQEPKARPKQTARCPALTKAWLKDPTLGPGPINMATGQNYTWEEYKALRGEGEDPVPLSRTDTRGVKDKKPRGKQTPKTEATTKVKKEPAAGKEPKVKKETKVKKEPSTKPKPPIKHDPDAPLGLINGLYDLSCPTAEDEFNCTDLTLTLSLDGTTVWGAYDLGMFSGIIYLPSRPWQASNQPLPLTWRGRENGEGEMSFGYNCDGEISFLGNGDIEGWISVYGRCNFQGSRRPEAGTAVGTARSMRAEWEDYNDETYEAERTGRWG